jgi:hypothetical protein
VTVLVPSIACVEELGDAAQHITTAQGEAGSGSSRCRETGLPREPVRHSRERRAVARQPAIPRFTFHHSIAGQAARAAQYQGK